jgi:antitoxin component of MazEF toxin-antitoxin module
MKVQTRKADAKGRVTLFPDFAGELVVVERVSDDEVRVRKAKPVSRKYTLAQLIAGVTPENIHAEVDTGPSVGGEAW